MALDRDTLTGYLRDVLGVDTSALGDDDPLVSGGVVDSFALVDLVAFIETTGRFRMTPGEFRLDNLDSIGRILRYCEGKHVRPPSRR